MDNIKFYPKTNALILSMALRNDHGFGLYEKPQQEKIIEKMNKLYDAYIAGKSDEQISEELGIYIVTVKQVREEVDGTGFFKPTKEAEDYYHSFKNE